MRQKVQMQQKVHGMVNYDKGARWKKLGTESEWNWKTANGYYSIGQDTKINIWTTI